MDLDQTASFLQCKAAIMYINLSTMILQLPVHNNMHSNSISPCPLLKVIVSLEEEAPQREEKKKIKMQSPGRSISRIT